MPTYTSTGPDGDVVLANALPEAEYMYGCTPTAVAMILGYYDLYGYRGTDLPNMIEGDVDSKSRGTDGNAYNMNAFDTALGRATATESFVSRFHARDGKETTPKQELTYAFKSDNRTLDTDVWDCIADYLGTGQFWRGNENLSTTVTYGSLEELYENDCEIEIKDGSTKRTVRYVDTSMLHGLNLYVQSRGYALDGEITGCYLVDVVGGSFTFADYMREIDAGRPVMISVQGHSMAGYGYNEETQEIIFDDCYVSGRRMKWNGTYRFDKVDRKLQSVAVIGINVNGSVDLALETMPGSDWEKLIVAGTPDAQENADYCFAGTGMYLRFTVSNLGATDSGDFSAAVRVDGETVSAGTLDSIAGGSSRGIAALPLGKLAVGMHNVRVVLDESNDIQELSGSNNAAETDILVLKSGTSVVSSGLMLPVGSHENVSGVYVQGGANLTLAGGQASDTVLRGKLMGCAPGSSSWLPGEVIVSQGGCASGTDVYGYGRFDVLSGGRAGDTRIHSQGTAFVRNGAAASDTTVRSGGKLTVSSGGKLTGRIQVEDGASARINSGGTLDFDLSCLAPGAAARVNDLSRIKGTPLYTLTVSGTQEPGAYTLADGAGGFDRDITVTGTDGGTLGTIKAGETVLLNGIALKLNLDAGVLSLTVSDSALVDLVPPTVSNIRADVTTPTWGSVTVTADFDDDRALAQRLYRLGENGAWLACPDGGVTVTENTVVFFKAVDASGNESETARFDVSNIVSSGCVAGEGQTIEVLPGRTFTDTALSDGGMVVSSGGTADGVEVADGGRLTVLDGGAVTGRMSFAPGADVSFASGAVLDFDVSLLKPGADAPANGLSAVRGTPLCTLTVSGTQAKGMYRLADGAGDFGATVSVRDAAGTALGTLAVGQTADFNGAGYSLNRSDGSLTLTVGAAGVANGADCGWNGFLYDKKTKTPNNRIRESDPAVLKAGTTEIVLDTPGSISNGGRHNFIGFRDDADYRKISLESAAALSFSADATDAAKFVVYRLVESTDKNGDPAYKLKTLQTTSLSKKKKFAAATKPLLLEKGDYYVSMQAANTKQDGSVYYNVSLDMDEGNTVFYSDGDGGGNNWLYDKKTKAVNEAVRDAAGIALTPGNVQIDDETPSGEGSGGRKNFVGFGDEADFAKLDLPGTATVSFNVTASGAAKFIVYSLTEGTDRKGDPAYKLKAVQTTTLSKKKNYTTTTTPVQLPAADNCTYYISMQAVNAKKNRSVYYSVSFGTPESASESAALLLPDCAASALDMPGSLPAGPDAAWTPDASAFAGITQSEDRILLQESVFLA